MATGIRADSVVAAAEPNVELVVEPVDHHRDLAVPFLSSGFPFALFLVLPLLSLGFPFSLPLPALSLFLPCAIPLLCLCVPFAFSLPPSLSLCLLLAFNLLPLRFAFAARPTLSIDDEFFSQCVYSP